MVDTPYPGAPRVVCYRGLWERKLERRSPHGTTANVVRALSNPSSVYAGTSNRAYIAFVSHADRSSNGSPFVVIVDPNAHPLPVIASIGYRRDFKDHRRHQVLWQPRSEQS